MTKKRIADLLKEEVEKPAKGKASSTAAASSRTRKRTSAAASGANKQSTAKSTAAKSTAAKTATAKTAKSATTKSATTSKSAAKDNSSALTKKLTQLEAALEKSTAQVVALQEDVDTHQSRIFELKDTLKKTEGDSKKKDTQLKKLTAELEDAKAVILKMSAAAKDAAKSAAKPVVAEKAPLAKAKPSAKSASGLSLSRRGTPYSSYKSIPEYAIQRGTPAGGQTNSMMSDDDIGWVD